MAAHRLGPNSVAFYWLGVLAQCANDKAVTEHMVNNIRFTTWRALNRRGFIGFNQTTGLFFVTEAGHREARRES